MTARELNNYACYMVFVVMLIAFIHAAVQKRPEVLVYRKHPSTTIAFLLWAFLWAGTVVVYEFLSAKEHPGWVLAAVNLGNMGTFGAAIAYMRGNKLNLSGMLWLLSLLLVFLCFWNVIGAKSVVGLVPKLIWMAPSLLLTSASIVLLGWVFYVRWGGVLGGGLIGVTIAYAFLQLPAFVVVFIPEYLCVSRPGCDPQQMAGQTTILFVSLAVGKVLYATGFFALFFFSDSPKVRIDSEVHWPDPESSPETRSGQIIVWAIGLVLAGVMLILSEDVRQAFFVWRSGPA